MNLPVIEHPPFGWKNILAGIPKRHCRRVLLPHPMFNGGRCHAKRWLECNFCPCRASVRPSVSPIVLRCGLIASFLMSRPQKNDAKAAYKFLDVSGTSRHLIYSNNIPRYYMKD
jgi:hypothetical protein